MTSSAKGRTTEELVKEYIGRLERLDESMTAEQEALGAWLLANRLPFACVDRIEDALATLSAWGALRIKFARAS